MFDIIFISYNENEADENYANLKSRFGYAKRVHGVEGIHKAHIEAAKIAVTEMFWIVDADAIILDSFDFSFIPDIHNQDAVHVWTSTNPINNLEYGYGGVKLFPRQLTLDMDVSKPDMTTSISEKLVVMPEISNITAFNVDEFSTWRSAFRECAKLASKTIDRQNEDETNERLQIWTTVGGNVPFGKYAIAGAIAGREFGLSSKSNLQLINDYNWLEKQFKNNN